jgi:hypothetical protein
MRYFEALQAKAYFGSLTRHRGQTISGFTGTMAAGLTAASTVLAARYPSAALGLGILKWMHLHYTCLLGFTAPITAGRRLSLKRGSGADATGGTDLDVVRDISSSTETLWTGKVASTTGLGGAITYETATRRRMQLAHAGVAGVDYDELWVFDDPLIFLPGQVCGIVAPAAFDAVGTWQLSAHMGVSEVL